MEVDYIIAGQGLAGSLLACELSKLGKKLIVFDDNNQKKASSVAAGLVNPIVFRRMTKSWLIDELYPALLETYTGLEKQFGTRFYYPIPIKKVLGEGEAAFWTKKREENELQNYIPAGFDFYPHAFVRSPFGIGEVAKSARVDLSKLLSEIRKNLVEKNQLREERFDFDKLALTDKQVTYKGIIAKKIIFCEGHLAAANPFFRELKFRHTKGEILRIKPKSYRSNFILNKALFLLPEQDGIYRLGATYNWKETKDTPSKLAKIELQKKLAAIFNDDYTLIDHQTGIRPTAHDRRPIIGSHPQYTPVAIFNGLGSKGTMLAPYFASQLANHLTQGLPIHPKADINRFF